MSAEGTEKVGKKSGGVIIRSEATSAAERTEMQKTEQRPGVCEEDGHRSFQLTWAEINPAPLVPCTQSLIW